MDALSAQTSPDNLDNITQQDFRVFHHMVSLTAEGCLLDELLAVLGEHFESDSLAIYHPDDFPPDSTRLVMVPLQYREQHISTLCLTLPPDKDGTAMAARLAFFAPVFALALNARRHTAPGQTGVKDIYDERDRLESILEATNDAILMVDTEGVLVMATLQFETFTGIRRYEVLGHPAEHLARRIEEQDGLPVEMAGMLRALASNRAESLGGEFNVRQPQRRVLVWYSLPVYAQSGTLLGRIFALRDVTREREADRMKNEFVTLVSHELRTPLTSVKGFSDLLLETDLDALDDETREYAQIIALNADRLIALINDILDITRIETDRVELTPDLCPMDQVITQVATSMQPMIAERGHTLKIELEPYLPPAWADRSRMIQIVTNLLSNAVKYTLDPGQITVRACYIQQLNDLPAGATRSQILPCVMVSVQDTGMGIAPKDQQHVFERFYRAKTRATVQVSGTGLGLAIVKSFAEMQGGQVWFESEAGQGSTFFFTVPVVEGKALAASEDR